MEEKRWLKERVGNIRRMQEAMKRGVPPPAEEEEEEVEEEEE